VLAVIGMIGMAVGTCCTAVDIVLHTCRRSPTDDSRVSAPLATFSHTRGYHGTKREVSLEKFLRNGVPLTSCSLCKQTVHLFIFCEMCVWVWWWLTVVGLLSSMTPTSAEICLAGRILTLATNGKYVRENPPAMVWTWISETTSSSQEFFDSRNGKIIGSQSRPVGYLRTVCGDGYTGKNCGECIRFQYYKKGAECQKCPSKIILGLQYTAIILGCLWSFVRKEAGISSEMKILFQALQLIGTFPSLNLQLPPALASTLNTLSVTNINIDVFSSECTV
jgi:hypothetical protein